MASANNHGGGSDNKEFIEVATHGLSLAYLRDFRSVVDYLVGSKFKKGTCIIGPFIEGEKYRYAYVKLADGSIKRFKISLPDKELRNQGKVSAEDSLKTLSEGILKFPETEQYSNFNAELLKPGQKIKFKYDGLSPCVGGITFKNNREYFDISIDDVNFRNKRTSDYHHSGDRHKDGYFYHGIQIKSSNVVGCIRVTGYKRTPVMKYIYQVPVLIIIDAENNKLYYYPVPLVEAIVGKETTSFIPIVMKVIDGELITYILPKGVRVGNSIDSTSKVPQEKTNIAIREAEEVDLAEAIAKSQAVSQADSPGDSPSEMPTDANADTLNSVANPLKTGQEIAEPILTFCQQGVISIPDIKSIVIHFGKTLSDSSGPETNSLDLFPLISPLILGSIECGIYPGEPNLEDPNAIQRALDKKLVISLTRLGWNDKRARTWMKSVNGIHIIQIEEEHSSLSKGDIRNRVLSGVSLDSANVSGPQSIILVRSSDGHLYWITGIRWPGLVNKVPKFGEEVTDLFTAENINTYAESDAFSKRPFPNLQEKEISTIYYGGKSISCQEFMDEFPSKSTLEEALSKMDDLIDTFNQIQQLVMEKQIFADIKGKIAEFCDKFVQNESSEIKELKLEIVRLLKLKINPQAGIGNLQEIEDEISSVRKKLAELKAIYRRGQSDFQPLITLATNFNSFKANSTIGFMQTTGSLKTVEKQKKMTSMINSAKNSLDSLENIANTCLFTFDLDRIKEIFSWIPFGASLDLFFDQKLAFGTDNRLLSLCGDDIACFLEMQNHCDLHLGNEGSYLSIMGLPGRQFFVLPLIDEYVHHLCRNWADDAIEDDVRNHFRVWYRGMIAECTLSREISMNFSPSSPEVGKIYIVMMAQIMLHIKRQFNTKLSYQDGKESTMVAALRSAAGYILAACGSGSNQCFSPFWFFFSTNNPMNSLPKRFTELDFWLIKVFAECLPYMGIPETETKKVDVGEVMKKYQQSKAEGKFQEAEQLLKDNISNKNELDTFLDNLKVFVGIQLVKFHMVLPVKEQIIEAKQDFMCNYHQECVDKSNLLWVFKFILCQVLENFVEQCEAQFSGLKDILNKGRKYQKTQMSEKEQKSIYAAILSARTEPRMKAIATSILGMIDYLVKKFYPYRTTQIFLEERNGTRMLHGFLCLIRDNKLDKIYIPSLFHVWEIACNVKAKAVRRKHIKNPEGTEFGTQTWDKEEEIWQNPNHDIKYDIEHMRKFYKYLIGTIINDTFENSTLVYQKACGILTGEINTTLTSTDVAPVKISPRDKFIAELGLSPKEVIHYSKISRAVSLMLESPEKCVDAFLKNCKKKSEITASQMEELIKLSGLTPEDIKFYWRMLLVNDDEHKVIAALRTRLEKERCDKMEKALQENVSSEAENAIEM